MTCPCPTTPDLNAKSDPKGVYRCGTLQYTKFGLFMLFTWLLWGDFVFQTFESAGGPNILRTYLQQNYHVSNTILNNLFSVIPLAIGTLMTPIISFKSDRTRSRWGRRIPYMLFTAPFLCLAAASLGFTEDILEFFKSHLSEDGIISPLVAGMTVIGFLIITYSFFNEFVGTVFWYLFADVVPTQFLGRFMGLFQVVSYLSNILINIYVAPYRLDHMKIIFFGIAALYFFGFGLMCWRVKEGEYPPVTDVTARTTILDQIKIFCKECFSHPIYIMIYLMFAAGALSKGTNPTDIFGLTLGQHQYTVSAHEKAASAIATTPDGKWIFTGGNDGKVRAFTRPNPKELTALPFSIEAGSPVLSLATTPTGALLVWGTASGEIQFCRNPDQPDPGKRIQKLVGHTGEVRGVALSADGTLLVSAGQDKSVRTWDLATEKCLKILEGHTDAVNCVAFSKKADRIASGGDDGKIILWDTATGELLKTMTGRPDPEAKEGETPAIIEGHPGPVYTLCFAPSLKSLKEDGDSLVQKTEETEQSATEKIWQGIQNGARNTVVWVQERPDALVAYFKDVFSNESFYDVPPETISEIISEEGWLFSGGRDGEKESHASKLYVWDVSEGKFLRTLKGHTGAVHSIVYKPDLRMILSGSQDGSTRLWRPLEISEKADDQSCRVISGYTRAIGGIACLAEGSSLVTLSCDVVQEKKKDGSIGTEKNSNTDAGRLHLWNIDQGVSLARSGLRATFISSMMVILAFPFGMMVDRFHPIRMILIVSILGLPFNYLSFWYVQDYISWTWIEVLRLPFNGLGTAAGNVFLMVLFIKSKYGQMCSAKALVVQAIGIVSGEAGGVFMDWVTNGDLMETDGFRYGYLVSAGSATLSLVFLCGVYYYWKKLGAENYVAPGTEEETCEVAPAQARH